MEKPSISYEIEMKALLTKEEYAKILAKLLKQKKLINNDIIYTIKFKPDLRLRHSPKIAEIVCKEGDPTKIRRKEIKIPLKDKEEIKFFSEIFKLIGLKEEPPWLKHKHEFLYSYNNCDYVVCVQYIENFAYVLEVEFMSMTDQSKIHEANLRAIVKELGFEPIDPRQYTHRIKEYIQKNKGKIL